MLLTSKPSSACNLIIILSWQWTKCALVVLHRNCNSDWKGSWWCVSSNSSQWCQCCIRIRVSRMQCDTNRNCTFQHVHDMCKDVWKINSSDCHISRSALMHFEVLAGVWNLLCWKGCSYMKKCCTAFHSKKTQFHDWQQFESKPVMLLWYSQKLRFVVTTKQNCCPYNMVFPSTPICFATIAKLLRFQHGSPDSSIFTFMRLKRLLHFSLLLLTITPIWFCNKSKTAVHPTQLFQQLHFTLATWARRQDIQHES